MNAYFLSLNMSVVYDFTQMYGPTAGRIAGLILSLGLANEENQ
jgi:hypothetical protein